MMQDFFRYLVIGLSAGSIYAMLALGLVVIYRATGMLNLAQGEIALVSTYLTWQFAVEFHWPLGAAMAASMVISFFLGALLFRVAIQPLGDPQGHVLQAVMLTVALSLGLNAIVQKIWGSDSKVFPALFGQNSFEIDGVAITYQQLGTVGVLAALAACLFLLFKHTRIGLFMRAAASNPDSAALSGVSVNRMLQLGWGLAGVLGVVSGTFAAAADARGLGLMILPIVYALSAMTIGGFDSFVGAVVGGLIVGILTEVLPQYIDWMPKPFAPFAVIVVVLLVRPQGLFGTKRAVRV